MPVGGGGGRKVSEGETRHSAIHSINPDSNSKKGYPLVERNSLVGEERNFFSMLHLLGLFWGRCVRPGLVRGRSANYPLNLACLGPGFLSELYSNPFGLFEHHYG